MRVVIPVGANEVRLEHGPGSAANDADNASACDDAAEAHGHHRSDCINPAADGLVPREQDPESGRIDVDVLPDEEVDLPNRAREVQLSALRPHVS